MSVDIARVTGNVVRTRQRRGKAKSTGNDYSMDFATVLNEDVGAMVEVLCGDGVHALGRGEAVDLVVEVGVFGGVVQLTAVDYWPVPALAAPASAAASK